MKGLWRVRLIGVAILAYSARAQNTVGPKPVSVTLQNGKVLVIGAVGENKIVQLRFDELTLKSGAKIVTNGNKLIIKANRIVTDGSAKIISFDVERQTAVDSPEGVAGKPGSAGGIVELEANGLEGRLVVSLHGQIGGRGGPGRNGRDGGPGSRGSNGVEGFLDCRSGGGDGGKGDTGENGAAGQHGGPAGDGGILVLRDSIKREQHRIIFSSPPGELGPGGRGGAGGAGGPGGEGGSGTARCGGGHGGPTGDVGHSGPDGRPGEIGHAGTIRLE
jgi:hypothetical protein